MTIISAILEIIYVAKCFMENVNCITHQTPGIIIFFFFADKSLTDFCIYAFIKKVNEH